MSGSASTYRVFLGAPTTADLRAHKHNEESAYRWQTISSRPSISHAATTGVNTQINTQSHDGIHKSINGSLQRQGTTAPSASLAYTDRRRVGSLSISRTQSKVFPLATLEAASHRISLIYKNIIFDDEGDDEEDQTGMAPGMCPL